MSEAKHCRNGWWCKLHDCNCPCEGCLPHSDPSEWEARKLREEVARLTRERDEARLKTRTLRDALSFWWKVSVPHHFVECQRWMDHDEAMGREIRCRCGFDELQKIRADLEGM